MHAMLSRCPVCDGALYISEVACDACGSRVQSQFTTCRFCRLSAEQLQFVELFLRSRGNLSSVGEGLDISYPTVTRRLDAVIAALGLNGAQRGTGREAPRDEEFVPASAPAEQPHVDRERLHILEMLDRGEITAEEATRRLKDL